MFKEGDLIVYGNTGVCRVKGITTPRMDIADEDTLYYQLEPLFQQGVIYTPVDTKVFMRQVISKETAEELINSIPGIEAEAYHGDSVQQLNEHYAAAMNNHDCATLIELTMSIYTKRANAIEHKHRFGLIDERYMKRAEDMLSSEFSIALGIPKDDVMGYIEKRVAALVQDADSSDAALEK